MWETIGKVLTDKNAWFILLFVFLVIVFIILLLMHLSKKGYIKISTKSVQVGDDLRERDIIRQQVEWSHIYVTALYSQIHPSHPVDDRYNGFMTKYILEVVYSEIVDWITFNHIKIDSDYISIKQAKVKALVYSFDLKPEFKTPKFEHQIEYWVEDVIKKLVMIREVYK